MYQSTNFLSTSYQVYYAQYESALSAAPLSSHTRRNYLTQVRQFLLFAQRQGYDSGLLLSNKSVRDSVIEMYRAELKRSANATNGSINTVLATIKHFYRLNGLEVPVAEREPNKRVEKQFLQPDELGRLLTLLRERISAKDRAIVTLFLCCGLRLNECVNLNVKDIVPTGDGFRVVIVSSNEPRVVPLWGEAAVNFRAWWNERNNMLYETSGALFINRQGKRISSSGFDSIVRKTGLKARLVLSARLLRNTWLRYRMKDS